MGDVHPFITPDLQAFIARQHVVFVASAPLDGDGHVNLSPKGLDRFRVLSPTRVAYLDLVGSGNETSAHLRENGRVTFMFCAFDGPPLVLRLYGHGRTVLPADREFAALEAHFAPHPGARQIIDADITRVQTSCGYGVPIYDYRRERDQWYRWADKKGAEGLADYVRRKNSHSIDGLPAPIAAGAAAAPPPLEPAAPLDPPRPRPGEEDVT
jgi:hypothetical protein